MEPGIMESPIGDDGSVEFLPSFLVANLGEVGGKKKSHQLLLDRDNCGLEPRENSALDAGWLYRVKIFLTQHFSNDDFQFSESVF